MSNKFILLIVLFITPVLISGCIFDKAKGADTSVKSDLIPTTNLPDSFTYMGSHEIPVNIGSSSINATEDVYRNNRADIYIQVIENDKPAALLAQYKFQKQKQFKTGYNPFQETSLNGHNATLVTEFSTVNGRQRPNYAVIWATGKAMISVGSPTADLQTVLAIAKATGS
ncbi:Uncharacterised protein [uncultured archaeon]|nr:Uncharacterised protein [uncultured archaeon]